MSILTMESWTITAGTECDMDCDCDTQCYNSASSPSFQLINTTHGVSVTDNPEKYEGFDARDDICIAEGPSNGTCLSNFRFFVISKAPFETAV